VVINCVSPGGIPRINRLNNDRLERNIIDFIESRAQQTYRGQH
jgi:glutathione synthase